MPTANIIALCTAKCDKMYAKPGDRPVRGMHLVKEVSSNVTEAEYTFPMHPKIVKHNPGIAQNEA